MKFSPVVTLAQVSSEREPTWGQRVTPELLRDLGRYVEEVLEARGIEAGVQVEYLGGMNVSIKPVTMRPDDEQRALDITADAFKRWLFGELLGEETGSP